MKFKELEELKDIESYKFRDTEIMVFYGQNGFGDSEYHLYLNEEHLFSWIDNANIDYPEDLSWNRMISDVFMAGYIAGKKVKNEN